MSFQDPWNSAYEGIPADSENLNLGANRIRDLKVNVRERANVDHSWGDTLDNGRHNVISFNAQTGDPPASSSFSALYSRAAAGTGELFYEDTAGRVTQLTSIGELNGAFASGTRMAFLQATPPPGWNFVSGLGDRVIRMVDDGTGGQTGGSWTISGVNTGGSIGSLAASSVSNSSATSSLVGTGLHSHTIELAIGAPVQVQSGSGPFVVSSPGSALTFSTDASTAPPSVTTLVNTTTTTTLTGSPGVSWSNDGTWRPAYANACLGQKI